MAEPEVMGQQFLVSRVAVELTGVVTARTRSVQAQVRPNESKEVEWGGR